MARRNWTHNELLLAFNLYCKLPFGLFHSRNPEVIALSKLIDRTPSAVAMKLANFASIDPKQQKRGISGLSNRSKADEQAWREFTRNWEDTVWESELLLARLRQEESEHLVEPTPELIEWEESSNDTTQVERMTKVRVGQRFFRETILSNYRSTCCICGLSIPRLLIASHIIPWRERDDLRLNPQNGLCLCALHDKAFDAGYLTVDEQYRVIISQQILAYLPNDSAEVNLIQHQGSEIILPDKFMPKQEFLKYHATTYFRLE